MSKMYPFNKFDYRLTKNNILKIPGQFLYDLKMCGQRAKRGWCEKDTWNIDMWFLNVMPEMLTYLKKNRHGSPAHLGVEGEDCHEEWDKILDEMIFAFKEANEDTCSLVNKYDEEYYKAFDEFTDKYGFLGSELQTEEELLDSKNKGLSTVHFMRELPEYEDIDKKHFNEEMRIEKYRDKMKRKALRMFSKYINDLWD